MLYGASPARFGDSLDNSRSILGMMGHNQVGSLLSVQCRFQPYIPGVGQVALARFTVPEPNACVDGINTLLCTHHGYEL
jgi:hypothetical protein